MDTQALMSQIYAAFNRRDIDGTLAAMSEDVSWPKASEGGRVVGKPAIREYWTRQWSEFDPLVNVLEVIDRESDVTDVQVHQLVKDREGNILSDTEVWHVYRIANGLIVSMDIKEGEGTLEGPSAAFSGTDHGGMRTARCSCGSVEIEAFGPPMTSAVCYCDTCQQGAQQVEALPNAVPILDPDGGTAYVLYRKDRIKYAKGAELLQDYKLNEKSTTSRVVASCCNSAMVMRFDDAKHWVPVYRARFQGDLPPLQWRICTKYKPENTEIPTDIPSSAMYPAGFMWKLLTSKIAMLFSSKAKPLRACQRCRQELSARH